MSYELFGLFVTEYPHCIKSTFPDFPSQIKKVQRNLVHHEIGGKEKKTLPFITHYITGV